MARLIAWYQRLPRAGRWLLWTVVVLIGFFGIFVPVRDQTIALNERSELLRLRLDDFRERMQRRSDADAAMALGTTRFGMPQLPANEDEAVQRLYRRINDVVGDQRNLRITQRRAIPLAKGVMADVVDPGHSLSRFVVDLELEATPELITEIIADLESSPEVSSVNRVSLRRVDADGKRLLRATISPEVWVLLRGGGA